MRTAENSSTSYRDDARKIAEDDHFISESRLKRIGMVVLLMLAAFLVGYVPGWLSANGYEHERDQLQRRIAVSSLRHALASASIHASAGRFDDATSKASEFFGRLRSAHDTGDLGLRDAERQMGSEILQKRDETIAALARGEASAAQQLNEWYFAFAPDR